MFAEEPRAISTGKLDALSDGAVTDLGHPERLALAEQLHDLGRLRDILRQPLDGMRVPRFEVIVDIDHVDRRRDALIAEQRGEEIQFTGQAAKHDRRSWIRRADRRTS